MDTSTETKTEENKLFVCPMCDYCVALPLPNVKHFCRGIIPDKNTKGLLLKPCKKLIPLNS